MAARGFHPASGEVLRNPGLCVMVIRASMRRRECRDHAAAPCRPGERGGPVPGHSQSRRSGAWNGVETGSFLGRRLCFTVGTSRMLRGVNSRCAAGRVVTLARFTARHDRLGGRTFSPGRRPLRTRPPADTGPDDLDRAFIASQAPHPSGGRALPFSNGAGKRGRVAGNTRNPPPVASAVGPAALPCKPIVPPPERHQMARARGASEFKLE